MKFFPVIITFAVFAILLGAPAYAQGGRRQDDSKKPTPIENAREMFLKYYPGMAVRDVFPSRFNQPNKNDGRYAATVAGGGTLFLKVADIKGKEIKEIFEQQYDINGSRSFNVTFTNKGEHVFAVWLDPETSVSSSNIEIYSLTERRSRPIFSLYKVQNLGVAHIDDSMLLLMQRWPSIVNNDPAISPSKAVYFILGYEEADKQYFLVDHLTKLPDSDTDVSARLNNQAVEHYKSGNLRKAQDLLNRVVDMAGPGATVSRRNLKLIQDEINSLEMQKVTSNRAFVTPNFDDARLSFFTGSYRECINIIKAQGRRTSGERMVMLAICYAQTGMWGDLDMIDSALARADQNFRKEYLSYLVDVLATLNDEARYFEYLKTLETLDKNHPNLIAHKARLMSQKGRNDHAAQMLDSYLSKFHVAPGYRAKLVVIRWELAFLAGDNLTMSKLESELYTLPKPDLSFIAEMISYPRLQGKKDEMRGYPIEQFETPDLDTRWIQEYLAQ